MGRHAIPGLSSGGDQMIMTGKTQAQVDADKAIATAREQIATAEAYLRSTDWKEFRFGTKLDPAVAAKRITARTTIITARKIL